MDPGTGVAAAEAATAAASVGLLSIVPPVLAIALALWVRNVLVALLLGVYSGALIANGWNPFAAFGRTIDAYIVPALADADHASILIFTTLLGGMVGLVTKNGGTHGIVERLRPWATSAKRGQTATWAMGLSVFFDDYANTLIVGPTMRPITDKLRVSREKLAYIVDSTAAPVVCLIPISTWVGFEIGLIGDAFERLGLPFDAYGTFLSSIPYRFYPILAIVLVLVVALSGRDVGAMLRAERRARTTGKVLADDARPIAEYGSKDVEPPADAPHRAINALLPIATVVVVTVLGLWRTGSAGLEPGLEGSVWIRDVLANANSYHALLWASLAGLLVALVLPLVQGILTVAEAADGAVAGMKAMFLALLVLVLAWSLSAVCSDLGTAEFLVAVTQQAIAPGVLPALTFVLAAAIAFATGSSWGTMGILEPLIIPIAHALATANGLEVGSSAYMTILLGSVASVLTGAVWGDHCSPISDTTILSSMASGCDHVAHVRTQLPYALGTGAIAILLLLSTSLTVPAWMVLPVGLALVVGGFFWLSRPVETETPQRTEA